ncbi:hypothetical protein EGI99_19015 [Stutzerimonas stutzeri]|nr:hypothetical protein EGI99_19015 [Stutzerimonas stutzeri]
MSAILEAAQLQGNASIIRRAWAKRGKQKVHLWELSTGGVILLRKSLFCLLCHFLTWFDSPLTLYFPCVEDRDRCLNSGN